AVRRTRADPVRRTALAARRKTQREVRVAEPKSGLVLLGVVDVREQRDHAERDHDVDADVGLLHVVSEVADMAAEVRRARGGGDCDEEKCGIPSFASHNLYISFDSRQAASLMLQIRGRICETSARPLERPFEIDILEPAGPVDDRLAIRLRSLLWRAQPLRPVVGHKLDPASPGAVGALGSEDKGVIVATALAEAMWVFV